MKRFFAVICMVFAASFAYGQEGVADTWNGTLEFQGVKLRLVFHVAQDEEGALSATLDSPDQGVFGFPVTSVTLDGDNIVLQMEEMMATYKGTVKEDAIEGTFSQMGMDFPMVLTRGRLAYNRPQTPVEPFPYESREISFMNEDAGIRLAGTLTLPERGVRPLPLAVLLHGSGPNDRNEEVHGHRPFEVMADYFARRGIATLRYDKRGVGESEGDYEHASIDDFLSDALAAMRYAATLPVTAPGLVGLVGHSEGGLVATYATGREPAPAFVVSLAGPAVKGDVLMKAQRQAAMEAMSIPQPFIDQNERLVEKIAALIADRDYDWVSDNIDMLAEQLAAETYVNDIATVTTYKQHILHAASPAMRSFLASDPAAALAAAKCPMLALFGAKDVQVPADLNAGTLHNIGNKNIMVKVYDGLNHLFQNAGTGAITEYVSIEETISPGVLEEMAEWILKTTKAGR